MFPADVPSVGRLPNAIDVTSLSYFDLKISGRGP
jgi:hypothetical protein